MAEVLKKAAIYARVSTRDKGQDPENQLRDLRAYCQREGLEAVEYVDRETGTGRRRRGEFERMLADAERGKFQVLVVWALDRVSREGTLKTLLVLDRLNAQGVKIKSLKEAWLDPASPTYELLVPIFAWIAKQEATRISERVRAGLARARAMNVQLGRPRIEVDVPALLAAYGQTPSIRTVAERFNLSRSLVHKVLKEHRSGVGEEQRLQGA